MKKMFVFLFLGWAYVQASYVWQPPVIISNPEQQEVVQEIALDPNGNAVAVWRNASLLLIQAATKLFGEPWSAPETISNLTGGVYEYPLVRVDAQGNAIVVWSESLLGANQLSSAVKIFGQPWSSPNVVPGSTNVSAYDLALDPNGNATVVFDNAQVASEVFSNARTLLGSWGTAVQISNVGAVATEPTIAVDSNGNVIASWIDQVNSNIIAATKPFGMPWQLPGQIIITGARLDFPASLISVNATGDAMVIAVNNNGAVTTFKPFNQAWQTPQQIPGSMNVIINNAFPGIGLDNEGNAIAVWYNTSGALSLSTQLSGQAWSTGQTFSTPATPHPILTSIPSISIDPCGLVLFGWNGNGIQVSSGMIGGLFSTPVTIGSGREPFVAQNPCNHAMVIWDNASEPFFSGPTQVAEGFAVTGVNSFGGSQETINFGTEKSFTNRLMWIKSSTLGVSGYRLYRNGAPIATVGPTVFAYDDIQQKQNKLTQYSITVIDANGIETSPITINVP